MLLKISTSLDSIVVYVCIIYNNKNNVFYSPDILKFNLYHWTSGAFNEFTNVLKWKLYILQKFSDYIPKKLHSE